MSTTYCYKRIVALALFSLWAPATLAQIVAPVNQTRLSPISDQANAAANLKATDLGSTRIDFSALSPSQRAELIRLLADPNAELSLRAWDGAGSSEAASDLLIERQRVAIDSTKTDGVWWFEYVNNGRSALRARWQLSRLPFPEDLNNWRAPIGLVSQGEVPEVLRGSQANRFKLQIGNFLFGADPQKLDNTNVPGQTVTSVLHSEFPASRLYLRVLALGRSGTPVTRPSNSVIIEVAPTEPKGDAGPALPRIAGVAKLIPARIAAADRRCHFIATRAFVLPAASMLGHEDTGTERRIEKGEAIDACQLPPEGLLGDFESHQGSAAYISSLVKGWESDRYRLARDEVYDVVFRNFGGPEGGCNSHCRQALGLALDRGAATLGVPRGSSINDPDITQGLEYLRLLMTDALRVSDLPEVVHEQASQRAAQSFRDSMFGPSDLAPPPFEADPSTDGAEPRLLLTLAADESESAATHLQVRDLSSKPRIHTALVPIPAIPAGTQIEVPIQLSSIHVYAASQSGTLDSIKALTAGLDSASALLQRVDLQLREAHKRHAKLGKEASRGNYDLELSWRDGKGQTIRATRLRCKASSGVCKTRR